MLSVPSLTQAQSGWKAHDMARPHPPVVTPGPRVLPVPPPSDAVVLFDGTDLSQWGRFVGGPSTWTVANDYMEVAHRSHEPAPWRVGEGYFEVVPGAGDIRTKAVFGDIQLHIEWAAPVPAAETGPPGMVPGGRMRRRVSRRSRCPRRRSGSRAPHSRGCPSRGRSWPRCSRQSAGGWCLRPPWPDRSRP